MDTNFNHFRDPYDRLEELEIITTGQSLAMEQMSIELKNQGDMFVQLTESLVQFAKAFQEMQKQNDHLQNQCKYLHHRLVQLDLRTQNEK
jgi:uncharacterized coiled-coil protein SlyX